MVIRLYYGNSFPINQKGPIVKCGSDKDPSRVPRYQNLKFFGGFCEKFFKPLTMWGEVW
jgi:hypothetical protein